MGGFCQRDFGQTNEHQRHLNKKPISELHWEAESIQSSSKTFFLIPLQERNFVSDLKVPKCEIFDLFDFK
jgi:hypothetical protein